MQQRRAAFTMSEILMAAGIVAMLLAIIIGFVPNFVAVAKRTSNEATLKRLNDALNEYKTLGGLKLSHSLGGNNTQAKIDAVVSVLRTGFTNDSGSRHNFLNLNNPIDTTKLWATGERKNFVFSGYGTAGSTELAGSYAEHSLPAGVGYMANGGAQAYTVRVDTSSGYFAAQNAAGVVTIYAQGTRTIPSTSSFTFWSCAGAANSTQSGNLTRLDTIANQLTELKVAAISTLTRLSCHNNSLTSIDVRGLSNLTYFTCQGNQLTSLDVSGMSSLLTFTYASNPLTALNVSNCTGLTGALYARGNGADFPTRLTSLNVTGCSGLTELRCHDNDLVALNVTGCTSLAYLGCAYNQLTSIVGLQGCASLGYFSCNNNQLTSLDVSGMNALATLNANNNPLTSLNVSGCTSIVGTFYYRYGSETTTKLTSLNVTGCSAVADLRCSGHLLTSLDVSGCTSLSFLSSGSNSFGAGALDAIYGALPNRTSLSAGAITVTGNPGTSGDNPALATAKNWTVTGS